MISAKKDRYQRPVLLLTSILVLVQLGFTVWHIYEHYTFALAGVKQRQHVYITALAEHAERSLGESILVLDRVEEKVRQSGGPQKIQERQFHDVAVQLAQAIPQIGSIFLVDSHGTLIADSFSYPIRRISLADRGYFKQHYDNSSLQLYFSRPYKSKVDNTWRFGISRRLNNPDGSFAGIISVSLHSDYFQKIFKNFYPLPTEQISLLRADGYGLVTIPLTSNDQYSNMRDSILFTRYLPNSPDGCFETASAVHNQPNRMVSYRILKNAPLVAAISIETSAAMAPWRRQTAELSFISLFSMAIIIWFAGRLTRQMNHYHITLEQAVRERTEELNQAVLALERSNKELEQFAYVASHDLQEPLRMVASFTQLLAQQYQGRLDAEADEYIHYAVDGATRMQTLIQDLLSYSRVTTRGNPAEEVSLNQVMAVVRSNLQLQINDSHTELVHDELPTVMADPVQMVQLLQNLISNAIKFKGTETPQVHVSAADTGEYWRISVSDNGIGIEPQYFERIFKIFQRLHNRDTYPGTGIGLAICNRIVERHGGQLTVDSAPGKGSIFSFTLPKASSATSGCIKEV